MAIYIFTWNAWVARRILLIIIGEIYTNLPSIVLSPKMPAENEPANEDTSDYISVKTDDLTGMDLLLIHIIVSTQDDILIN